MLDMKAAKKLLNLLRVEIQYIKDPVDIIEIEHKIADIEIALYNIEEKEHRKNGNIKNILSKR